ncbi:hypothetical protein FRB99_006510 [Tulasnella sp. 403]|nr:hypothetical protein FRB99_006510 [Tulasnella sp. 403]
MPLDPSDATLRRQDAIVAWDTSLDGLEQTILFHSNQTNSLFEHFRDGEEREAPNTVATHGLTAEDALQHIDSRLKRLEDIELILHNTRIALQGLRNTSTVLSPVGRLPPEIISYIIALGDQDDVEVRRQRKASRDLDDADDADEDEVPDDELPDDEPPHFPTLVSHVCKRWRRIALDTAMLWTRITFREGPPYEKVSEWVRRSRNCELEVKIDAEAGPTKLDELNNMETALKIVKPHAGRINSLSIRTAYMSDLMHVVAYFSDSIAMPLRYLSLAVDEVDGNLLDSVELAEHQDLLARTLSGVVWISLKRVALPYDSQAFRGLESLKLSGLNIEGETPSYIEIHNMLLHSPRLKSLDIESVDVADMDEVPDPRLVPVHLPELEDFVVTQLELQVLIFLFSIVDAPNLELIRLRELDQATDTSDVTRYLSKFFDRLDPTALKRLRITDCTYEDSDYILMLSAAPSLEDLYFNGCDGVTDRLLWWLKGKKSPSCPKLRQLSFNSCSNLGTEPLKKLVKARHDAGNRFETLTIKYCPLDLSTRDWLEPKVGRLVWEEDEDDEDEDDEGEETDMTDIDEVDAVMDEDME